MSLDLQFDGNVIVNGDIVIDNITDGEKTNTIRLASTAGVLTANGIPVLTTASQAGSGVLSVTTTTSNYTTTIADCVVVCNAPCTITLPDASSMVGKLFAIKRNFHQGKVTVTSVSGIDGHSAITIVQNLIALQICSNGTAWFII